MKLVEGKMYRVNFQDGTGITARYDGYIKEHYARCPVCGKEQKNCHTFTTQNHDGYDNCYYNIGSSCKNKLKIEEVK